MIRYLLILILVGYSFNLRLKLFKKDNSFSQLYKTCDKTSSMMNGLNYGYNTVRNLSGKLQHIQKNNVKLLYNYRICIAALEYNLIKCSM